uniref:Anthranilate synthase component 2 n=1 Tax=Cyanidiococcus yangmingshanensis TaxID=2690220 RepID=A0A7G5VUY9_9RHOD|nr:anthranilate synthase component II [Cyanidiococcus yangmingshanensis]QMX77506.1 anthranilate synthase component II [Cyanidiococcus yangmingshanensis]UNJ15895.1 anthranilate synthase component 2 [Cyanidioschyzonaceae sp. 3]WDB00416.1 anthranilate synthase component 2 [Cyanidiococcus yangmingshanensis]
MILLIDNYDSFTYNLVQSVSVDMDLMVCRNDELHLSVLSQLPIRAIIISPGPGHPNALPSCMEVVSHYVSKVPILGVCLGHQLLAQLFQWQVKPAPYPMHGKVSLIFHQGDRLFHHVPNPFYATRYHSLLAYPNHDHDLQAIAHSSDGLVMAFKHAHLALYGVQFHPESILTTHGHQILNNFLSLQQ